jgi:hypothetical protein
VTDDGVKALRIALPQCEGDAAPGVTVLDLDPARPGPMAEVRTLLGAHPVYV